MVPISYRCGEDEDEDDEDDEDEEDEEDDDDDDSSNRKQLTFISHLCVRYCSMHLTHRN